MRAPPLGLRIWLSARTVAASCIIVLRLGAAVPHPAFATVSRRGRVRLGAAVPHPAFETVSRPQRQEQEKRKGHSEGEGEGGGAACQTRTWPL